MRFIHRRFWRATAVALLATGLSAPGLAHSDTRRPLLAEEINALEFGKVTTDGVLGGSVTVDPHSGQKSLRSGAVDLGGYHSPATFRIVGEPNARFVITLPDRVELSHSGKAIGHAVLEDFRSDSARIGILSANGEAIIRVGATLRLPGASGTGQFRSDFAIYVDYED